MLTPRSIFVPAALGVFGALLCAAGVALTLSEISPFLALATSDGGRMQAFSHGDATLPVAESSRAELLASCYETSRTTYARAQPAPRRKGLLDACAGLAEAAWARAPTLALAPALAASFAAEEGQGAAFNADLLAAQRVAPNEQWLAEFRVSLTEDNYALAGVDLRAVELRDLAILVHSRRGIGSIAQRYIAQPAFRERVTRVVETLPQADQQRFLSEVKAAARAASLP